MHFGVPWCHGGELPDPEVSFVSSGLQGESTWGRPAVALVMSYGSLLIADAAAGASREVYQRFRCVTLETRKSARRLSWSTMCATKLNCFLMISESFPRFGSSVTDFMRSIVCSIS